MRRVLPLVVLLASSQAHATIPLGVLKGAPKYISVGVDTLPAFAALDASDDISLYQVVESDDERAILRVRSGDLERISHELHEHFDRCGGFMLHDSLEDARLTVDAQRDKRPIDYTLDHPADVRAALAQVDPQHIVATIRELQGMGSRYYRSASGAAASQWLADRWQSFTTRTDVTIELVETGYPQKSVILTIPGTTRADEVIVIGGHLDSISLSGYSSDAPGADDDASGIATMTEVARVLLASDYRPARTIKFMAYAAEEVGLRGSLAIAKDFKARNVNVVGALQLDMTNYQGSDKDIWLMKDFTSAAQNTFLVQLIETYVGATWGMDSCGYACSDHASWNRIGVPASMPFESRMNQRNKHIHTGRDTLETSGDNADHAAKFARLAAAYAIELGKGELGGADRLAIAHAPSDDDREVWTLATLALLFAAGLWLSRPRG
jgi:bacterial leucyl aminopeptidase